NIDHLLEIDERYRELSTVVQTLREERNALTKDIKTKPSATEIEKGRQLKEKLDKEEDALRAVEEELKNELLKVPNIAADDVPIGSDETGNKEVKKVGTIEQFNFTPKPHEELAVALDLYDTRHAVNIAGTRAYFLKNELVLLEQAMLRYAL